MAEKRSNDELESFTVRIPTWLKDSVGRVRNALSIGTMSDAARFVLEAGANTVDRNLADTRDLVELQKNEQTALQKAVQKWRQNQPFSRAELAFLAQWAHSAYLFAKTSNVQRAPLASNLEAFRAVRSLRQEIYGSSDELEGLDRYYHGNIGNSGGKSFENQLKSLIAELKEFPYCSQAEFASRCLEVALRDEPLLPVDRLNQLLRPYLPAIIKLALRGYLQAHKGKPALPVETGFPTTHALAMKYPKPITKGNMYVSPNILGDSMTAAISWEDGNVIVSINGFLEINELIILVGAAPHEAQVSGQRFIFFPPTPPVNNYVMRVDGVQVTFADGEFDDLRAALEAVMQQPIMSTEYDRLAWLYGDI